MNGELGANPVCMSQARPHAVSEHWSSALLEEWSCQAMLERELGLPPSVAASADEVTQAKGQIGFIDLFVKPLFDTTASVIPCTLHSNSLKLGNAPY